MELKKMTKDFYDHMKEEQKLSGVLTSKKRKNGKNGCLGTGRRNGCFQPNKNLHTCPVSGFKDMGDTIHPGVLMIKRIYEWFLWACEHGGSKVSNWAWHKRWNNRGTRWNDRNE
jgi:hypothetical protein